MKVFIFVASLFLLASQTYSASAVFDKSQVLKISSEQQLSELLLGYMAQNLASSSEKVKKYLQLHQISILNAVEQVEILFVAVETQINDFEITRNFVEKMGTSFSKINMHFLSTMSEKEIDQYKTDNLNNKKFQQINVSENELVWLKQALRPQTARLLEESVTQSPSASATPSPSYITKFFFILMFIIVTFGTLGAIASMDNRKDSLLYAKFITDVNGR